MNNMRDEDIKAVIILIKDLQSRKFTGNVQINFKLGGISNVNKLESFKITNSCLVPLV